MDDGDQRVDRQHAPPCRRCRQPTRLLTILPRTTQNPTYWIYGCAACGCVEWIAEKIDGAA